jgi:iron complex outermembrane receptor protein
MNSAEYFGSRLSLELGVYSQYIRNYIFLQPSDQTVVSLRGTFPVFDYRQTNATFTGFDFTGKFSMTETFDYEVQAAVVRARDIKNKSYLPWIPADQVENRLRWHPHTGDTWQNGYLELQHRYVARQNRFEPASDYASPPPAYQILSASAGTNYVFNSKTNLNFSITVNNLTNNLYKDYMNRFRYYSHDIGRNFTIRTILKF